MYEKKIFWDGFPSKPKVNQRPFSDTISSRGAGSLGKGTPIAAMRVSDPVAAVDR
jgi:hypothetical protein